MLESFSAKIQIQNKKEEKDSLEDDNGEDEEDYDEEEYEKEDEEKDAWNSLKTSCQEDEEL